jgi:hypothetical protein
MNASAAMLHLARDTDDCTLAVGNRRTIEKLDQIGHQPLAKHRAGLEQRLQEPHHRSPFAIFVQARSGGIASWKIIRSSVATDRFRIRHQPLRLAVENR